MKLGEKIILRSGTRIRVSEIGYYDVWYPSSTELVLKEDIVAFRATGFKISNKSGWTPYTVEPEVASRYGSPVKIIWAKSGED